MKLTCLIIFKHILFTDNHKYENRHETNNTLLIISSWTRFNYRL